MDLTKIKSVIQSLANSQIESNPFKHWLVKDVFPTVIYNRLIDLPLNPLDEYHSDGQRSSYKNQIFFNEESCNQFSICKEVVSIFQFKEVIERLEIMLGISLSGSYLRIGYYVDKEGSWLEPHTDLSVKLVTMTIYLFKEVPSENLGTDLFDSNKTLVTTTPSDNNTGLIFLPTGNTWHGFNKRRFTGLRKTLIINYVTEGWQNRQELCYPVIH